ncbi:MAG TPA: helix-turn-helix domain-containing protein [Verrucomicrobiae bacterium]|jgi:AraC-like DNA-binding protein
MESINFLTTTGSQVTRLDLKDVVGESPANKLECTFWTRADGQVCIHYFSPKQEAGYQPHTHSEYTIMVCLAGELTKTEAEETCIAHAGEAFVTNAGVEHATGYRQHQAQVSEVVCITFAPQILSALAEDFVPFNVSDKTLPALTGILASRVVHDCAQQIAQELSRREAGHKIILEILAMRLMVETLRAWPRDQIAVIAADAIPRLPQRDFVRAYEFMRRCDKGTFRLEHLCRFLGISKERFTRLFLASTNCTPANFYNRMLLERGRELLRDARLSIKEISFQLGFKTTSHFIVAFRREFAAAPQEYRLRDLIGLPDIRAQKSVLAA